MNQNKLIGHIHKIIRNYLSDDFKIYLFGSWANHKAHENSDIDIAILGNQIVTWNIMVKILNEIDEIPTLRRIDIVDLKNTSEKFKKHVLKYANPILNP